MRLRGVWAACVALLAGVGMGQALAADRLARIQASGQVQVCIWPDYYGISLRDPRTLQLSGIDVDLAHELAHRVQQRITAELPRIIESTLRDFLAEQEMISALTSRD